MTCVQQCVDVPTPTCPRGAVAEMLVSSGVSQTWVVGNKLITVTTSGCSQRVLRRGLCDKCLNSCDLEKRQWRGRHKG